MMDKPRSLKSGTGGGGGGGPFKEPPALVPFQGIGTRLRRSRSKDHSSDRDNLSSSGTNDLEIANLKRLTSNHIHHHSPANNNGYDGPSNFYSSSGTLERPKRFFGPLPATSVPLGPTVMDHSSFIHGGMPLYGMSASDFPRLTSNNKNNHHGGSSSQLYEESRLLSHQYEEPQYLIDSNFRARLYSASSASSTKFNATGKQRTNELNESSYPANYFNQKPNNGQRGPTTIIPPSKLFAKTLSTSYKQQPTYELATNPNESSGSKSSGSNQSSSQSTTTTTATGGDQLMNGAGGPNGSSPAGCATTTVTSSCSDQSSDHHLINNGTDSNSNPTATSSTNNQIVHPERFNDYSHTSSLLALSRHHKQQNGDHMDVDDDDDEDADDDDDDDDDEPTASLVGVEDLGLLSSSGQMVTSGQSNVIGGGQHYSAIMHTYANPFQNNNAAVVAAASSGAYSETEQTTTGPIIPSDINTMRPSQLLKNSYAGSAGPPLSLQSGSSDSDRNLVSYLAQRLMSYLRLNGSRERKTSPPNHLSNHDHGHHHHHHHHHNHGCFSWLRRFSTLLLIILVFILVIIIIFLTAMNKDRLEQHDKRSKLLQDNSVNGQIGIGSRVPCVVVEDLESTSTSHLSSSTNHGRAPLSPLNTPGDHVDQHPYNSNCQPSYFPRDSSHYKEISLLRHQSGSSPISLRLAPFSSWSIWFQQQSMDPVMYINFQFYTAIRMGMTTRLALVANKNEPPSLTMHQIFKVINSDDDYSLDDQTVLVSSPYRTNSRQKRDQLARMQFKHAFEQGSWYLSVVNDADVILPLVVNISIIAHNQTSQQQTSSMVHQLSCANNCHNHGYCHLGKCQCFPGFIGHDCADNVCPVFCGGHGQYLQGSCRCEAGWKGQECTVRSNECEISDCNGNGVCIEGQCQCRSGFKGDHCDQADCIDPDCSGHGVCLDGNCFCRAGFAGMNCSEPDTKLHKFFPNCSDHGVYDFENGRCMCHSHYTGADCSELSCSLDCGQHGSCREGRCVCEDGWSGSNCQYRKCDVRCLEHGKCHNGTCHCHDGWMGKHCTLNGCTNSCSKHGRCVSTNKPTSTANSAKDDETANDDDNDEDGQWSTTNNPNGKQHIEWRCHCDDGWHGHDCSAPQETSCNDEIDNDNDGLVDCADSECCHHEQCGHQSLMCITSPDPLDILLRKQPPSPTSSFFQKVLFLIEDGSVQSYAQKEVYSPKRAAVIRGQVVSKELNGLIGIRVSVVNDLKYGFTLTRSDGWFDILVNGGGIITLQFQRNPFYPIKKSIYVGWNDITVIQNPIVMFLGPGPGPSHASGSSGGGNSVHSGSDATNGGEFHQHHHFPLFNRASLIFHNLFSSSDFGESNWLKWMMRNGLAMGSAPINTNNSSSPFKHCTNEHDYEQMKPLIHHHQFHQSSKMFITPNFESICDKHQDNCIVAETQTVQERIRIGTTGLYLVYQSSQTQGYTSSLDIQLTPSIVPKSLRFILLRILVEGNIHEKIFEADPNLHYKFNWNKRNVYKQKVYGFSQVKIYIGYYYHDCPYLLWSAFSTKLRGYDMEISDIGQWNLEIHNRYNPHDGIFQRGDGQFVAFNDDPELPLILEPFAGMDGHPRPFTTCSLNPIECNSGDLRSVRFFSLVSLASAPDGSIFVGDANLIRRITPDGQIITIYKFRSSQQNNQRQNFEYHIAFNSIDQYLYISDPERFQIVRIQIQDVQQEASTSMPDAEIVVGTGEQCFPHDRFHCDDGKTGPEVQLIYPKHLAFGLDGSLFFSDGHVIRMLDTAGYVRKVVGQFNKRQWNPMPCDRSHMANNMKLKWPTSLAIHPIDGTLYFIDNHVLFKLNQNMQVNILSGYPSFCVEEEDSKTWLNKEIDCQSINNIKQLDARTMAICGDELLFGEITFAPNGVLYLADISRRTENRIFSLMPDGSLRHVAGFKTNKRSGEEMEPCPVEKCIDMAGHNCTCLIEDDNPSSDSEQQKIALKTRIYWISSLTTTGDGIIYLADEGRLRLYSLQSYVPEVDDQHEIKILFPNSAEMYVFNKHGQHVRTRSITTGRTLYSFVYNQETSSGKLTEIIDSSGHKLLFIRDKSGSLHMIESAHGLKCRTMINKQGLLESFTNGGNISHHFDYYNNGLIRTRDESHTGKTYFYQYNSNGRIRHFVQPDGVLVNLQYNSRKNNQNRLIATEISLFQSDSSLDLHPRQTEMIIGNSMIKFINDGVQTVDLQSMTDGSFRMNSTSENANQMNMVILQEKVSRLSLNMLSIQAQLFPLASKFTVTSPKFSRDPNNVPQQQQQQLFEIDIDYRLRLKSTFIDSVEKFISINNNSALKIEYDWNANREIYYNQSQRPILFVQYDDYGRPIQWIPNNPREHWMAHSITYDNKHGLLDTWQNGHQKQNYLRDRLGRLTELRQQPQQQQQQQQSQQQLDSANNKHLRFIYSSNDNEISSNNNNNPSFNIPSVVTFKSGHKYSFDLDHVNRIRSITLPKGSIHNLSISLILGSYKFSYCPPTTTSSHVSSLSNIDDGSNNSLNDIHTSPSSHCYLVYFNDDSLKQHETRSTFVQPTMVILPFDTGKIIYHYGSRYSHSKDFAKDFFRIKNDNDNNHQNHIAVNRVIHGTGLVERWFDRKSDRDLRGIWRNGQLEFAIQYKYARTTLLLKHQSYLYSNIHSVSQLSYTYRYDNLLRLRSMQAKLGSINLPSLDFAYDSIKGEIESIGNFRYFERSPNETLIGDGIALLVRRYDPVQRRIRYNSLTVSDKEVFRADYIYDDGDELLIQTRTFMHHLGANKVRIQNFTYDTDDQLIEMQGREHWRFVYDPNGNLITFLYMGNRVDIEYDHGDRIRNFGKSQHNSPGNSGTAKTPYQTDLRGFVVQRGDEYLYYNNLGQLIQAITPNRYEVNYVYDYKGRLVLRRDHQKNVTQYFYGHPLKPHLVTHSFNNADGRVLSMIYDEIDDLLIMIRLNNENFYVVCDQTKSPVLIFDHRGQVVKEIHRSPYGHVLFDSNPNFHIPVDFHGGIPDPLTNLVHFHYDGDRKRVYDTLTGRWLVPNIKSLLNKNLIKQPKAIHLYQFEQNNPVNSMNSKQTKQIMSLTNLQLTLLDQTMSLVNQDINYHLNNFQMPLTRMSSVGIHSLKSLIMSNINNLLYKHLQMFSTFQQDYYSKLTQNDWTDDDDDFGKSVMIRSLPLCSSMITWKSNTLFGKGIVMSLLPIANKDNGQQNDILHVHFSHSSNAHWQLDPVLRESLIVLVNGSHLLDVHPVLAGQDYYFLVKDSVENIDGKPMSMTKLMAKLKQFQTSSSISSRFNLTVQEVPINDDEHKKMVIEAQIHQPTFVMIVRFGTSVPKERERVLRWIRKHAVHQRLAQERFYLSRGLSTKNWDEQEKQFVMSATKRDNLNLSNGPLRMDYYHPMIIQMAEDANNVIIKRSS